MAQTAAGGHALAAAALVITPLWTDVRDSRWGLALVAALLGLAMLGHGSSAFGVIPLGVIAVTRTLRRWRSLALALGVLVVLLAPWSAYQKYGDPPGNRLTNWALAGITTIDGPSTLHAVTTAYRQLGVSGTLHSKGMNFQTVSGGPAMAQAVSVSVSDLVAGKLADAVLGFRLVGFFYLLPAFGLLLLAPVLMIIGRVRRRVEPVSWSFALRCAALFAVTVILWCLIMFGNAVNATVIHQGSYLVPILGFCVAVAGLRATFPKFAIGYLGINAAAMLALYAPDLSPPLGTSYSLLAAFISGASLAGFLVLALRARPPAPVDDCHSGTAATAAPEVARGL